MIKTTVLSVTTMLLMGVVNPLFAQNAKQVSTTAAKTDLKFLDITVDVPAPADNNVSPVSNVKTIQPEAQLPKAPVASPATAVDIETAKTLQFKYALLLNIEVEQIQNMSLFKLIDEWMGTRYKMGGTTKFGVDCSGLMQNLFTALRGITIPRTAHEQYSFSKKVAQAELKEGDLVFFNTRGGVSHVGMYLANNKFVHASSGGVTISDLEEDYWSRHFIGAGRIETLQPVTAALTSPQP